MSVFNPRTFPPNEFWDYSVRLYARDGVEAACLGLQQRLGLDVNLLLFCCWVAASGRGQFEADEIDAALTASLTWHGEVVETLRTLRQRLKTELRPEPHHVAEDLRRVVRECELQAERIEQLLLFNSMPRDGVGTFEPSQQPRDAAENVKLYCAVTGRKLGSEDVSDLGVLFAAAFGDTAGAEIAQLF